MLWNKAKTKETPKEVWHKGKKRKYAKTHTTHMIDLLPPSLSLFFCLFAFLICRSEATLSPREAKRQAKSPTISMNAKLTQQHYSLTSTKQANRKLWLLKAPASRQLSNRTQSKYNKIQSERNGKSCLQERRARVARVCVCLVCGKAAVAFWGKVKSHPRFAHGVGVWRRFQSHYRAHENSFSLFSCCRHSLVSSIRMT